MKTLTDKQQEYYDKVIKDLALRGIEIDKVIELWKHPAWYIQYGKMLEPKEDVKNSRHYIKYQDQFGVFHSALLPEKHFVTIREITPEPEYGDIVRARILAEADGMWFITYNYTFNGEWSQLNYLKNSQEATFCTARNAYNTSILILDKEGNIPVPKKPIMVCEKHNYAYSEDRPCEVCSGKHIFFKDWDKPKINPAPVSVLNEGIYTLPKR